ncbi:MAG: hypothetical protein QOG72_2106 [Sphingomonadales bacterium]|jgi:hypothetical protein|nr:hypothetical protein [Sphingomonadales bacterium]
MIRWNDKAKLVEILAAIVIPDNSDDVALFLARQVVEAAEELDEAALPAFLEEVSHYLGTDDPYRAAIIAWIFGCLAESEQFESCPDVYTLDWAARAIRLADDLFMKACSELPKGEMSSREEIEAKVDQLVPFMPVETRAWQALKDHYSAITTPLRLFPHLRKALLPEIVPLSHIASDNRGAYFVLMLIRVPVKEKFVIIQHDQMRGIVAEVTDIENNFQLFAAVSTKLAEVFDDESLKVSETSRELALSPSPPRYSTADDSPTSTCLMGFQWKALRSDGSLPEANASPMWQVWSDGRAYLEDHPWEIEKISGYRVLLLRCTSVQVHYFWGRNYGHLSPAIEVTRVLDSAETADFLQRFTYVNRIRLQGVTDQFDEWESRLITCSAQLPSKAWEMFFFSRLLRRMIPHIHSRWPSHASPALVSIYRIIDSIDAAIVDSIEVQGGAELAGQVVTYLSNAARAQLVRPTVVDFARSIAELADWVAGQEEGRPRHFYYTVFNLWEEALREAKAVGGKPDRNALAEAVLADSARLAEVAKTAPLTGNEMRSLGNLWPKGRPDWWPLLPEFALAQFDYEVVISFAGEQRVTARNLAGQLRKRGCRVFYDEDEQQGLLGKTLSPLLRALFRDRSMSCVALISADYAAKPWPRLEWAAIGERLARDPEYLLPLRIDDTRLEGVSDDLGFLDLRRVGAEEAANAVADGVARRIADQFAALRSASSS